MSVRLTNWGIAAILTVIIMTAAIPRSLLFDSGEWSRSFQQHPWIHYLELPLYLAGIVVAALLSALAAVGILRLISGSRFASRVARFVLTGGSVLGLSPLQPVFANLILILLLPTLADAGWFPFAGLRWVFTVTLVSLFGLTLGAELALRVSERSIRDSTGWMGATAHTLAEQAPALAGRLAVILMAGPLMASAVATIGRTGSQIDPDAPRFAFPVEGLFVGLVAVLVGLTIWVMARRIGGREPATAPEGYAASTVHQAITWGVVVVTLAFPLVLLIDAGDPLMMRTERVLEPPSAEHRFGTDPTGRDVLDRAVFAWRDTLYAGLSIGIVLAGIGMGWRLILTRDRSLLSVEAILERLPPGVIFFGLWGIVTGIIDDAITIRSIAFASGIILIPTALPLIRSVERRALPAAAASLVMLGMLLVIGWSTVFGLLGLIQPPLPSFGDILLLGRDWRIEAPWIASRGAMVILVAVLLPATSIAALSWCYGIPRGLLRLRG